MHMYGTTPSPGLNSALGSAFTTSLSGILETSGLLHKGKVKSLTDPITAIYLVTTVVEALPVGSDLLDAFTHIPFGPLNEGEDINGVFQRMAEIQRKRSKLEALQSGLTFRAAAVNIFNDCPDDELRNQHSLVGRSAARLVAQSGVIGVYRTRPDWWSQLWPESSGWKLEREAQLLFGQAAFYQPIALNVFRRWKGLSPISAS